MKKHYYTDSLAAAWMARHFNMEFDRLLTLSTIAPVWDKTPWHIYPDSLRLLEPQVGDIISFEYPEQGNRQVSIVCKDCVIDIPVYEQGIDLPINDLGDSMKIIQRNGKPFFWPEVEE